MKDHRPPLLVNSMPQRRNSTGTKRRRHWAWGALCSAILTVAACEWITPLDYGGNAGKPNGGAGGQQGGSGGVGGNGETGGSTAADTCAPACRDDQTCEQGKCTCRAGTTDCDGACVESIEDAGYCGACGTTCRTDQICGEGSCVCRPGENECTSSCVNLTTDPQHCGACDITCRTDHVCTEGKCTCSPVQVECNGTCIGACRADQVCGAAGKCACPSNQIECKGACITSLEAAGFCGACGTTCPSGQTCVSGVCKTSPCDSLCNPEPVALVPDDGFRVQSLGSAERCLSIEGYVPTKTNPRVVCWNLDNARTMKINGQSVPCTKGPNDDGTGHPLTQTSLGWYCVQVSAGADPNNAGLILPIK
jgi:hypothetical protein